MKFQLACSQLLRWSVVVVTLWIAVVAADATESVTLAWDPSPDASVAGYYLRYGTVSQTYSGVVDTGAATVGTVNGLVGGQTYYFTVAAYTVERLESEPAGEIAYTVPANPVPAPAPGILRMVGGGRGAIPRLQFLVPPAQAYQVEASEDLRTWNKIHTSVSLTTNWIEFADPQVVLRPKRFYRLALLEGPEIPGVISLLGGGLPAGAICLRPSVVPGQQYQIEASEDLTTWTSIHEGICVSTVPMDFVDAQARLFPKRFYRLALPGASVVPSALSIVAGEAVSQQSRLRVQVLEGHHYRIQASEDLAVWTTLYEGISQSTEPVELMDPQAGSVQRRFYRLAFD